MSTRPDVLIVGAGPAGSFLGYLLACQGLDVSIIDKADFPRDKVCGGGISNKTVELLPFDISPVVQRRIAGAFLTYRNQQTVVKDLPRRGGVTVLRSAFDHFLLQKALGAGARFYGRTPFLRAERLHDGIEVTTRQGTLRPRYLVGADGVFSQVRRSLFGRGVVAYAPAVEALVTVPARQAECLRDRVVFDFGGMPRGYGWIFPKREHLNVGIFSIYPTRSIKAHLSRFMSWYSVLGSPQHVKYAGHSVPLKNRTRAFEKDNVLLLGDAAGFAESFYGEGIFFALRSAALAAEALGVGFDHPSDRPYSQLVRTHIQPDLTYSGRNARMFYPIQRLAFHRMVRNRHVNRYFAELIAGGMGQRECFYRTILTSPYWLLSRSLPPHAAEPF